MRKGNNSDSQYALAFATAAVTTVGLALCTTGQPRVNSGFMACFPTKDFFRMTGVVEFVLFSIRDHSRAGSLRVERSVVQERLEEYFTIALEPNWLHWP